ncbi:TPA: ribonuclease H [Candidatus Berkelbacteria bacterium]|uniref:Ribonuclease H, putative phosphoglycerate mutase n=1 Tax=Berkelbacteria bacterium GW2011_GWE1_39_12 TaxID=1618337 RepID=A0A0G4B1Q1_9BACT|nr:MAG: ribonuclease H, putative phosphoglycerate mutase [Berkelbacteria bacterium GW2011_GWE1_39_12]HBO60458.1 ribonuclease H [Candidatus Berkelbacteria bacterium]
MQQLTVFTDGGSRGNPGHAGIGFLILPETKIGKYIGVATNNQAEYTAVLEALKYIVNNFAEELEIQFYLDSQLVVEQLNGNYKLKNEGLKPLFWEIRDLILRLGGKVFFQHVPREQNKVADKLVNEAIDEAMMKGNA